MAKPFDFAQILEALLKLIERFKFQSVNFLSAARTWRWRGPFGEPGGSIAVGFRERQETTGHTEAVL